MKMIGISGPPCSGKDTAADYLSTTYGFQHISTGDLLRDQARQRGLGVDRTTLQLLGAQLRLENEGDDPLLAQAMEQCESDTIFTGIRTLGAARAILGHTAGNLLYIESQVQQRYDRSVERRREDHPTYAEFVRQDSAEHYGTEDIDTALCVIRGVATVVIINDGPIVEYERRLDDFITNLSSKEIQ